MKKKILQLICLCFLTVQVLWAQNVGIGTATPDASAKLHIEAANSGLLIPNVSLLDINNGTSPVNTPATSLLVYNTNAAIAGGNGTGFYYWNGTQWVALQGSGGDAWRLTGNAGTNSSINFIGTTDAVDWVVRTNNNERMRITAAGNVAVGTASPNSNTIVHVNDTKAVLYDGGSLGAGGTLNLGPSVRMLWYPKKAAFMAGRVTGTQWDDGNIGNYSALFGYNNISRGAYNLVGGENNAITTAGTHNMMGGINNEARGDYNLISGQNNAVSAAALGDVSNNIINGLNNEYGTYGIINGFANESTNSSATINGNSNFVSGAVGTAFGGNNSISGDFGIAIGANNTISGNYGFVVGGNLTTGNTLVGSHSFVQGDNNTISSGGSFNSAFGQNHVVSGTSSHNAVFGQDNNVSGGWSLTAGFFNILSAPFSAAFGVQQNLSGIAAFGVGQQNNVSGNYAAALGVSNEVSGSNSQAIGYDHNVIGNNSLSLLGFSGATTTTSGQECLTVGKFINNANGSTYLLGSGQNNASLLQANNAYTFGVGFRHTDPTLVVYCPTSGAYGNVGVAREPLTNRLEVNGNASKSAAGSWLANSDGRLKKDRKNLNSASVLQQIMQLQGVTYFWDDQQTSYAASRPTSLQYGFIAQEFQSVLPDFVSTDKEGFLQMAYGTLDPLFIEAFKAQQGQIEALKKELQALKKIVVSNK